jgi:nucleoside-diphosphate-sugar epimerase
MLKHLASPETQPSRVVLIGRSGFVARYLIAELTRSRTPFVAFGRPQIDLTESDAAEALGALLQPTDTLVILAALTPDKGRDFRTLMRNLQMAESLCEVLERRSCAHVIYISSDAVYDAHKIPLDEDSSREPVDLYAVMHTAREMMLRSVLDGRGIPLCILRPVNIFGFGDTHNSYGPNRFIRQAFDERRIVLFGHGEERRNHLFVEDAARLIAACIQQRSQGELNVFAPGTISFMKLAEHVRASCGFDVALDIKPRVVKAVHRPYKITQVFRFLYNLGRPIGPIVHRPYVATQLRRAFPTFRFSPFEEAIARYVRQYGEHHRAQQAPHTPEGIVPA